MRAINPLPAEASERSHKDRVKAGNCIRNLLARRTIDDEARGRANLQESRGEVRKPLQVF
jgi:hypothetical protein